MLKAWEQCHVTLTACACASPAILRVLSLGRALLWVGSCRNYLDRALVSTRRLTLSLSRCRTESEGEPELEFECRHVLESELKYSVR
jgi:hypothetical protein